MNICDRGTARTRQAGLRASDSAVHWQHAYGLTINSGRANDPTILGARAEGPHTLVLTLEQPTPHLAQLTALTPWYPINPRVLKEHDALTKRGGEKTHCERKG